MISKYIHIIYLSLIAFLSIGEPKSERDLVYEFRGRFLTDSVKIGQPVNYFLVIKHDPSLEFTFPDSTFDFSPLEYVSSRYFSTKTKEGISSDSIVYTLRTFELDSLIKYALPIFINGSNGKLETIKPEQEIIFLKKLIVEKPESPSLKANVEYAKLQSQFNYQLLTIIVSIIGALGILILILFGKKIRRNIIISRLRKRNQKFILAYDQIIFNTLNRETIEEALNFWKKYTGKLIKEPLDTFTSKEIISKTKEQELNKPLKEIDKAIYAGIQEESVKESLIYLKEYAQKKVEQRINTIKNG